MRYGRNILRDERSALVQLKNRDPNRGVNHSQLTRPFKTCIRKAHEPGGREVEFSKSRMRCTFSRYKHSTLLMQHSSKAGSNASADNAFPDAEKTEEARMSASGSKYVRRRSRRRLRRSGGARWRWLRRSWRWRRWRRRRRWKWRGWRRWQVVALTVSADVPV